MVNRLFTFISFIILFPFVSVNANTLKGKITDIKGETLPGAVVEITDLKTGAVADINGYYHVDNLPRGTFLVEVHLLSFATITQSVTISGETELSFRMKESVIEKNQVVITGTSIATEERRSITPIQSIGIKEMHEDASSNIIDALTKIPGVSQVSTGPAISKPVIRGLGYNRIITLNDGVRQEGQQWGDEHGIEIDDYNVSRVEVLKGPASLAYGSDAEAGVINIISSNIIPEGKIVGNITTNYQTNNGLAALHAQLGGNNNGITWSGYVTGKAAHDYQNKYDGYVYGSRFTNLDFGASAGINKKWGTSSLSFTSYNQVLGIVEGERDSATGQILKHYNNNGNDVLVPTSSSDNTSYSKSSPYQKIDHQKLVWNNELYMNNGGRLQVTVGYQQNTRREFGDVLNMDAPGLSLFLQSYTYDAKYFLPEWKGWKATIGGNGMYQVNTNKGDQFLVPDYSLFDIGVYSIVNKQWNKWIVSGGLRYDFRTINTHDLYVQKTVPGTGGKPVPGFGNDLLFSAFSRNFSNISGSAGASYTAGQNTTLKFNVASGYRAPNIAELSANGVHGGTIRYEIGNTSLKAENSIQEDAGITWSSEHVLVNASIFDNYVRNFIFIRKLAGVNSNDSIPAKNNESYYSAFLYGQSDANLYGGELYVDFHPHPLDWLHLENTLSYVRGQFVGVKSDSAGNLPFIPPFRWVVDLRAQKKVISRYIGNAYAKIGLDINSAQNNVYSAYGTETTTAGYTLLNAGIGFDVIDRAKHIVCSLSIAGHNLTDVAYQSALSRLKYASENYVTGRTGVFNTGRNFSITAAFPLDFK
ncbi:MAG: TonB-dependent receptor [Taibaiella sp.]|nr:TonB-dependent receptor [Taibaiella sp.]